jgi:TetR/AcrR family transcriptional repressor of nem operon
VFEAAVNAGMQQFESNIGRIQAELGDDWLTALVDYYLSREHRENIAEGCVVPGLSGEVSRSTEQVRTDYQEGLKRIADKMAAGLPEADGIAKEHAWAILAMLAGGVLMSRAVQDDKLADEISKAVHDTVFTTVK